LSKIEYLCELIELLFHVPQEKIRLEEFLKTIIEQPRKNPAFSAVALSEIQTALRDMGEGTETLLQIITSINTRYILLTYDGQDEAVLFGPYLTERLLGGQAKNALQLRGYAGISATDINAYYDSICQIDEPMFLRILQTECNHIFEREIPFEIIDTRIRRQGDLIKQDLDYERAIAQRRHECTLLPVNAIAMASYPSACEQLKKLLQLKSTKVGNSYETSVTVRMQFATFNSLFRTAVLENSAVDPFVADEIYYAWMSKGEETVSQNNIGVVLNQMLEEYCI